MDLKQRKLIANGALPKFDLGFTPPSMDDLLSSAGSFNHSSTTKGVTTAADAFKADAIAKNNAATDALPSFDKKGGAGQFLKNNAGGIMNTAMSAINFANTIGSISKNNYSSDEMMGSGGTSQQSANGINYTEQRVDDAGIQKQIDATAGAAVTSGLTSGASLGMAVGSVIPGLGTLAGGAIGGIIGGALGIFGGNKAKREAERQKQIAINRTNAANTQNREQAYTIGLRNEFNRENVTDESQSLFHAESGVEGAVNPRTGATYKKHVVNTAYGKAYGPQNAWVSDGEVIRSKDGSLYRVSGGKNDTARAYLQDGDSVYSKKVINPETGNSVADDAASYAMAGELDRLDMNQNVGRMMRYSGRRRGTILPGYIGGTSKLWNTVKSIGSDLDLGNLAALGNAYISAAQRDARAEGGLRAPKSFVANQYEQDALQQLNSLHSDYYPVWAQNRELEARGKSSIAQSGGLSAGQKMLGYMGLANNTQQNNATALFNSQERQNALRAQAANAALQAGQNTATRQQQAYQWDEDMLAKAHAARENMLETSAYDRQNALTQFVANMFKRNQFNKVMDLYRDQQHYDKSKVQQMVDDAVKNTTAQNAPAVLPTAGTNTDQKPATPAETALDAAKAAQQGAAGTKLPIDQPDPVWDRQILSRVRRSKGENVKALQRNLVKALGQNTIDSIMRKYGVKTWDDGSFGRATEEALSKFQESQGWKTRKEGKDGVFGENSFNALMKAIKGK